MPNKSKKVIYRISTKSFILSHMVLFLFTLSLLNCINFYKIFPSFSNSNKIELNLILLYFVTVLFLNFISIMVTERPITYILTKSFFYKKDNSAKIKTFLVSIFSSLLPFCDLIILVRKKSIYDIILKRQSYIEIKSNSTILKQCISLVILIIFNIYIINSLINFSILDKSLETEVTNNKVISHLSFNDPNAQISIYGGEFNSTLLFLVFDNETRKSLLIKSIMIKKEIFHKKIQEDIYLKTLFYFNKFDPLRLLKNDFKIDRTSDKILITQKIENVYTADLNNTNYQIYSTKSDYKFISFTDLDLARQYNFTYQPDQVAISFTEFERSIKTKQDTQVFNIDFIFSLKNLKLKIKKEDTLLYNELIDFMISVTKDEYETKRNTITSKLERLKF